MLSIFSCACWPSACLLWRNVCLVFCPFFDLVICFLVFESYELFVNFEIKPLFVTSSANIFSHFVGCLFFLFIVSFAMQKPLSLISYPLPLFFKISIALWDWPKKTLAQFIPENVFLCSFLGIIWCHLLHLSLQAFWVYFCVWWEDLTSSIYVWLFNFPKTTCWNDCLFSLVYSCLLGQRLIDHRCVYFWALYSVPLIHISVCQYLAVLYLQ